MAGSPVTFSLTATAPSNGTIFTVVGTDHSSGSDGVPGPGTLAHFANVEGLAAASDGTIYFTDSWGKAYKLAPNGYVTVVAGGGPNGVLGDGGLATMANLSSPYALALDESSKLLYIADNGHQRVRVVDLVSGMIATYAGGGNAPGPGYGDSGPASAAQLTPTALTIGPDGALYVVDSTSGRIRRIDPVTGIITTWFSPANNCNAIAIAVVGQVTHLVFDAQGNAYISGLICGTSFGYSDINGADRGVVKRIAGGGSLQHIAGNFSGSLLDGVAATQARLMAYPTLALDAAGSLYLVLPTDNKIRRVDPQGKISTWSGTGVAGYAGDYVPVVQAQLNYPYGMLVTKQGHFVIADASNYALRLVW